MSTPASAEPVPPAGVVPGPTAGPAAETTGAGHLTHADSRLWHTLIGLML